MSCSILPRSSRSARRRPFKFAHLRVNEFLEALHNDRRRFNEIYVQARDIKPARDKKLAKLKDLLAAKFTKPTTDRDGKTNRKVLVFTAFSDTAVYLYENLHAWARETHQYPQRTGQRIGRQPDYLPPRVALVVRPISTPDPLFAPLETTGKDGAPPRSKARSIS